MCYSVVLSIDVFAALAQLVEHSAVNRAVTGSSPVGGVFPNRKKEILIGERIFLPFTDFYRVILAMPFYGSEDSVDPVKRCLVIVSILRL